MTSDDALQAYIDRKIPKELQPLNPSVSYIKAGWLAALEWKKKDDSERSATSGSRGGATLE